MLKVNPLVHRVWVFDEIASTQTFLEDVENLTVGDIVLAHHQTAGRGRLERTWSDVEGGSLLLSVALQTSEVLTLAVGVGVLRALNAFAPSLTLKWPNDIVVFEDESYKKLGGIITTRVNDQVAIAGIGINLIAPDTEPHAQGLQEFLTSSLDVTNLLQRIIDEIFITTTMSHDEVVNQFRLHTSTVHRQVRIQAINGKSIYGYVLDIEEDGALLLETDNGKIRVITGDVEYLRFSDT